MTDKSKAIVAMLTVGFAQILLVVYAHLSGQSWTGSLPLLGAPMYPLILHWHAQKLRASRVPSHSDSN